MCIMLSGNLGNDRRWSLRVDKGLLGAGFGTQNFVHCLERTSHCEVDKTLISLRFLTIEPFKERGQSALEFIRPK